MIRVCLLVLVCALEAGAAELPVRGSLLVAASFENDPDLRNTVVLMLRSDHDGAIGLVINAPSRVPVHSLFPHAPAGSRAIYKGGPLQMGINALTVTRKPPSGWSQVFGDVYLVSEKKDIEKLLNGSAPLRVYVGLCGWGPHQLESEIDRGVWSIQKGNAGLIFDPHPETVWSRCNR